MHFCFYACTPFLSQLTQDLLENFRNYLKLSAKNEVNFLPFTLNFISWKYRFVKMRVALLDLCLKKISQNFQQKFPLLDQNFWEANSVWKIVKILRFLVCKNESCIAGPKCLGRKIYLKRDSQHFQQKASLVEQNFWEANSVWKIVKMLLS